MLDASKRSDLVAYPIRDIVQEAKALEKTGRSMIYLNIGDPAPFGFRPPQHVLDAVAEALRQNYSGYAPSEGDPELREAAAAWEKISPEDVFITSGLSEGIDFLFQALLDPGQNIILPSPTYPLYITKERLMFCTENFYHCDSNWEPDIDSLRNGITKYTKAIVVINPNNPTGAVYSRKTLTEIVNIAGEFKLPIISDDAYELLVFEGEYVNMREICKDVPLISGNSLSKNFIYPGARVAWLAFHGEGLGRVKDAIQRLCNQRLSTNWEMQRGAIAALRGPLSHIKEFNKELKKRCDLLDRRIAEIPGLRLVKPKATFYAFVELEKSYDRWKSDWNFVRELLRETGVVVVPGSGFSSMLSKHYFRVVFLPPLEQLDDAMDRIENFIRRGVK